LQVVISFFATDVQQRAQTPMDHTPLSSLLAGLGNTPDEVASILKTHGIRGVPNTARFLNPLVRYLESQILLDCISLDVMQVDRVRLVFRDGKKEETIIPEAVRQFLDAFNNGAYPELTMG
jgi:hypothetical protein